MKIKNLNITGLFNTTVFNKKVIEIGNKIPNNYFINNLECIRLTKKCCKKEKNIKTPQIGVSKTLGLRDKNIKSIKKIQKLDSSYFLRASQLKMMGLKITELVNHLTFQQVF